MYAIIVTVLLSANCDLIGIRETELAELDRISASMDRIKREVSAMQMPTVAKKSPQPVQRIETLSGSYILGGKVKVKGTPPPTMMINGRRFRYVRSVGYCETGH